MIPLIISVQKIKKKTIKWISHAWHWYQGLIEVNLGAENLSKHTACQGKTLASDTLAACSKISNITIYLY